MFDYIVIGGGSAGCVLANRLTENPAYTVCILEAGPSDQTYWIRSCNPLNMLYLMKSRKKPFIYTLTDAGGFVKSSSSEPIPDLQLQFAAVRMPPRGAGLFTPAKFGFVLHVCHMRPWRYTMGGGSSRSFCKIRRGDKRYYQAKDGNRLPYSWIL